MAREGDEDADAPADEARNHLSPLVSDRALSYIREEFEHEHGLLEVGDFDATDINHLLLPSDDPLLDNSFDDAPLSPSASVSSSSTSVSSWDGENANDDNDDDDTEDVSYYQDSRFTDSGWGGECLRETEDIDFKFVYALHTFFATVEGQANATKGDTMVLLDDSNSYWWLVRVVKDSSIGRAIYEYGSISYADEVAGYLPAEHIETPTERLARLNKHRNIDVGFETHTATLPRC